MAIKRERETSKKVVLDDKTKKIEEKKTTSKKKEKPQVDKKKERFLSPRGLKEEYSKISWPTPKKIGRETLWIIIFLIIVSAGIAFADLGVYHFVTNIAQSEAKQEDVVRALIGMGVAILVIALIFYFLRDKTTKKKSI